MESTANSEKGEEARKRIGRDYTAGIVATANEQRERRTRAMRSNERFAATKETGGLRRRKKQGPRRRKKPGVFDRGILW